MFKNTHRFFSTLSKHVHNSVLLSTTSFVNNNNFLMTAPAISKISLSAFTCNITKRFCTETVNNLENENSNLSNPSVVIQKQIQDEAQKKLDELLNSNPERKKFYNVIELEIDLLRQSGGKVPSQLRPTEWLQILDIHSQNRRRNYLEFLWINEIKRINSKLRRKENLLLKKSVEEREMEEREKEGHLRYGLNNNTMFHRIYNNKMTHFHNSKLISAMSFGEKLVLDFGFESQMTPSEISSCAKQFMHGFAVNRENIDPYDILLCNVDLNGDLIRRIRSFIPTMDEPGYPIQITTKSYLEVFPKEDLIYLTPHTTHVLDKFIPNKVYIIGGIVDKAHSKPLTLAKAKEEGIQIAKFPLDSYVDFHSGSNKVLNINHCLEIMLTIKNTNSWEEAFKCIPTRKIIKPYSEYKPGKVIREIKNVEPKFRSGHASHLSDASFSKLKSLKFNDK